MSVRMPTQQEVEAHMATWGGRRGHEIPEEVFDRIAPVAHGISKQIWGSNAQPDHLQYLYDHGHHTPEAIHNVYGEMPHPHSPSMKVREYQKYSQALELFRKHQQ